MDDAGPGLYAPWPDWLVATGTGVVGTEAATAVGAGAADVVHPPGEATAAGLEPTVRLLLIAHGTAGTDTAEDAAALSNPDGISVIGASVCDDELAELTLTEATETGNGDEIGHVRSVWQTASHIRTDRVGETALA
ncbi:MAG TPA: hypothetical protein VLS45_05350 [Methylomicrobium sp.]|nr:hypothetical protein [Methylomicrobium sp.]